MDYYEVLGVSSNVSDGVLRAAYRQRLKEVHPDTSRADGSELERVKRAGEVLLSDTGRAQYDRRLILGEVDEDDIDIDNDDNDYVTETNDSKGLFVVAGLLLACIVIVAVVMLVPWSDDEMPSSVAVAQSIGLDDEPATLAAPTTPPTAVPTAMPATAVPVAPTAIPTLAPTAVPTPIPTLAPTAVAQETATVAAGESTDDQSSETVASPEPEEPGDPAADSSQADDDNPVGAADAELPDIADLPERGAIYRAPTLFLVGPVPTQEIADAFYAKAVAVLGEENVVNEYVVHPEASLDLDGNVRVEQAIQFETASETIRPEFLPVLGLALEVLTQNPQAGLVIEGHTDSVGTDEANLALSQARAQAVAAWLADKGIAADRLTAIGLGESQPVADNLTEIGRTTNRRIEVQITDLLS